MTTTRVLKKLDKEQLNQKNREFTVSISEFKLLNKKSFIKTMKEEFTFPGYFGENLDAVYDCMTDLEWIDQDLIVLEIKKYLVS